MNVINLRLDTDQKKVNMKTQQQKLFKIKQIVKLSRENK